MDRNRTTLQFATPHHRLIPRVVVFSFAAALVALLPGCPPAAPSGNGDTTQGETSLDAPPMTAARLDEVLDETLRQRKLTIADQAAWQILHGSLAYGRAFPVQTETGIVSASDYVLAGGAMQGWDVRLGDALGEPPRRGLRIEMDPGTKVGQGHRDQWLAILAQCGYPTDHPVTLPGSELDFTIEDIVRQALWDVPRNLEQEFSWTLLVLSHYRDTDFAWAARDGRRYSVESLTETEIKKDLQQSACGGTHRLIGLATIVEKRRREGRPITGVWAEADRLVQQGIEQSRQTQNADGSACTTFLHRPGWSPDLADVLRTTGHVLEFLAVAAPDATLSTPWVERSAERLCQVLDATQNVPLECGALYHAVHGLVLYRNRRFGERTFQLPQEYQPVSR